MLNPRPLEMSVIPVIVCVNTLHADPRRSSIGERRRLSLNTSIPVIVINNERGVVGNLVIGRREHFVGTRYKLVEWRQTHPDIFGIGRRWCGKGCG